MVESQQIELVLRGEHIALDALLKAVGWADSGGRAKEMIVAGGVRVDAKIETRRACKIRAGQVVDCAGASVLIKGLLI